MAWRALSEKARYGLRREVTRAVLRRSGDAGRPNLAAPAAEQEGTRRHLSVGPVWWTARPAWPRRPRSVTRAAVGDMPSAGAARLYWALLAGTALAAVARLALAVALV